MNQVEEFYKSIEENLIEKQCLSCDYMPKNPKLFAIVHNLKAAKVAAKELVKTFGVRSDYILQFAMPHLSLRIFQEWLQTICEDKVKEWQNET